MRDRQTDSQQEKSSKRERERDRQTDGHDRQLRQTHREIGILTLSAENVGLANTSPDSSNALANLCSSCGHTLSIVNLIQYVFGNNF